MLWLSTAGFVVTLVMIINTRGAAEDSVPSAVRASLMAVDNVAEASVYPESPTVGRITHRDTQADRHALDANASSMLHTDVPAAGLPSVDEVVEVAVAPETEPAADTPAAVDDAAAPRIVIIDNTPTFNGRPIRKVKTYRMLVTAYSPDERSCGIWADGTTASGHSVWTNAMKLVAADTRMLPFGSILTIPGYNGGRPVPVLDRGGKIKGHRLDVLYPTHEIATQWGRRHLDVDVWEYAD